MVICAKICSLWFKKQKRHMFICRKRKSNFWHYSEELKGKYKSVEKFEKEEISMESLVKLSERNKELIKESTMAKQDTKLSSINSNRKDNKEDNKEVKTSTHKQKIDRVINFTLFVFCWLK